LDRPHCAAVDSAVVNRLRRHEHGLSLVLFGIFVTTLVIAAIAGWMEFSAQQRAHGQTPEFLAADGYLPFLLEQVSQNIQSEFLALAVTIALAARLIHRGSAQSRDGQDEMKQAIAAVERRVDQLGRGRPVRRRLPG
jgi:hypothetical protein